MISIDDIRHAWSAFFHAPEPVATLCLFRILFGGLLISNACTLLPFAAEFFGPIGLLGQDGFRRAYPRLRLSLFRVLPPTNATATGVVFALLVSSIALSVGLCSSIAALGAWLSLVSLHHRNPAVFNAGDTVQRLMLLLLCVTPSGDALSFDCWLRGENSITALRELQMDPWPMRLMQIQISIVYLRSVY